MTLRETVISVCALMVTLLATLSWLVPIAYADDEISSSAASTVTPQSVDNEAVLQSLNQISEKVTNLDNVRLAQIEQKIVDRDYSEKLDSILKKIEKMAPYDNSKDYEEMKQLVASMSTSSMFSLVAQLLLIGVVLALIFVVSLRTNR